MLNLIHAVVVFVAFLVVLFAFGSLVMRKFGEQSIAFNFIIGFFAYYTLFHIFALPMVLSKQSLTLTSFVWLAVMVCIVIFSAILNYRVWGTLFKRFFRNIRQTPKITYAVLAVIVIQLFFVVVPSTLDWDELYYTGTVSTSLYTDTMNLYNPYTGGLQAAMDLRYALATFPMSSAVLCKLFAIHPLLLMRLAMPALLFILTILIYYKIARQLFPENQVAVMVFMLAVSAVNLFGSHSIFTSSRFLYIRTSQGKSILANVILPALILFSLRLYRHSKSRRNWGYMLLLAISGNMFSLSAMYVVPVALSAFCIPFSILKKDWRVFRNYAICLVPCLATIAVYFCHVSGYLVISVST